MMGIAAVIYSVPNIIAHIHTNVHSMRRGDPASTWALYHICPGIVRCHSQLGDAWQGRGAFDTPRAVTY